MKLSRFSIRAAMMGALLCVGLAAVSCDARAAGPTLRVCTGEPSLRYFKTAGELAGQLRGIANFDIKPSSGSVDNLRKLASGDCDAAIVQSDAFIDYAATTPNASLKFEDVGELYGEYAQLLCNRGAGIGSVGDLAKKPETKVAIGPAGSGSATTWNALTAKVPAYNKVNTIPVPGDLALTRVVKGADAQCLLVVSGLNTDFMKKANDQGQGKLVLVPFDDGAFAKVKDGNGHDVYGFAKIPGGTYKNLQDGMFSTTVSTIKVGAEFVILTDWYEKNQAVYGDLSSAVLKMGQRYAN